MTRYKAVEIFITLLCIVAIISILMCQGCVQIIVEKDRFKINTFLTSSGFESLHYDPNGFDVGKYQGIPADAEFVFDPLTKTFRVKVKTK